MKCSMDAGIGRIPNNLAHSMASESDAQCIILFFEFRFQQVYACEILRLTDFCRQSDICFSVKKLGTWWYLLILVLMEFVASAMLRRIDLSCKNKIYLMGTPNKSKLNR